MRSRSQYVQNDSALIVASIFGETKVVAFLKCGCVWDPITDDHTVPSSYISQDGSQTYSSQKCRNKRFLFTAHCCAYLVVPRIGLFT